MGATAYLHIALVPYKPSYLISNSPTALHPLLFSWAMEDTGSFVSIWISTNGTLLPESYPVTQAVLGLRSYAP